MTTAENYAKTIREKLNEINKIRETIYLDSTDEDRDYTDKLMFDAMAKLEYAANMVEMSDFKN